MRTGSGCVRRGRRPATATDLYGDGAVAVVVVAAAVVVTVVHLQLR